MGYFTKARFKTYKSDGAPFFFYIDVIPIDISQYEITNHIKLLKGVAKNSIMPLPLRVDRVFNGESSIIIRPKESISFAIDDFIAVVNPISFIRSGIEKLLIFTEIRSSEEFTYSLSHQNAERWWEATRHLYGRLTTLEEDFAAFLRSYIHTVVRAYIREEDLVNAAVSYCEMIRDICNKRIGTKEIMVETKFKEKPEYLYKIKEKNVYTKFKKSSHEFLYPSFIDIEIFDTRERGFKLIKKSQEESENSESKILKYLPLLFYDDLLECILQNLEIIKEGEVEILNPSYLLDQDIIVLLEAGRLQTNELSKYNWLRDFNEIKIDSILKSIKPTFRNF
jgi:hypothetical protein